MKKLSYPLIGSLIGGIFSFLILLEFIQNFFFPSDYVGFYRYIYYVFFVVPFVFLISLFVSPPDILTIPIIGILFKICIIAEPILIGALIGLIIKNIKQKKTTNKFVD